MKNLLILLVITNLSITPCLSKTVKQYDKYGRVTGYYKETSLGYTEYDRYGKMTGYYRHRNNYVVKYDKYGKQITKYKKDN